MFPFLVDTGTSCNLLSSSTWKKIGTPTPQKDETRPQISASNDVIPISGSVDLDVTVTTEDRDVNSQILQLTVTDQLGILGTDAINSLQLTFRNNPVKVHMDNIYAQYPEPPTSPGIMSTAPQGVPQPVEAWAWMPNSFLDSHDT